MSSAPPDDVPSRLGPDAPLWRGVDIFRTASLVYAVLLFSQRHEQNEEPLGGSAVLLGMALWTAYVWSRQSRPAPLQVADLVIACSTVLATALVDTPNGSPKVPRRCR